ncbi:ROK family transcriptional regulator [Microbacterium sp. zg-Y818]|uniref:ROK family transcriptional regulator n=1 Tax=unclassified Microbacterium TaxID=2609290 RepID=UPI00214CCF11|nr:MULTISPECIES: ROK family transcriptional regulator [unclassified Microbacterium]MCR2799499.1 ROK family transcriptional regulator [Microbacterium sp. zg.Y818]WIM21495.1 ROK family transcriptional regulator [Microbacterium sp. zg-Y818]
MWPNLNAAERGALRELLIHGPLPRAEIARRLGLSRASLTRVTRILAEHGLIREGAIEQRAWTGRPSELFIIAPDARHFFGVKLTGDAIYAVVTDMAAREVASLDEQLASRALADVVTRIEALHATFAASFDDIVAGGVCLGGDLTQDRAVVVDAPYLGWSEVPLAALLTDRLGIPIATENDVRALTAAEHWFGPGAGCSAMALITIGAGIGTGFVVDNKLVAGAHGRAGRLDHIQVDGAGPICAAGHRGCASAYLTSDAIVRSIQGVDTDFVGAVALCRTGHPGAVRAFEDAGKALGTIIGTVTNILDPQKIILTGDGLAVWDLAEEQIAAAIRSTLVVGSPPVAVDVQPFEFNEWARAAAVVGMRTILRF